LVGMAHVGDEAQTSAAENGDIEALKDRVAALNQSLVRTVVTTDDDVAEMDTFPALEGEDASKMQETKDKMEEMKRLSTLFKGLKFFL